MALIKITNTGLVGGLLHSLSTLALSHTMQGVICTCLDIQLENTSCIPTFSVRYWDVLVQLRRAIHPQGKECEEEIYVGPEMGTEPFKHEM